jgi:hypothetical protein
MHGPTALGVFITLLVVILVLVAVVVWLAARAHAKHLPEHKGVRPNKQGQYTKPFDIPDENDQILSSLESDDDDDDSRDSAPATPTTTTTTLYRDKNDQDAVPTMLEISLDGDSGNNKQ